MDVSSEVDKIPDTRVQKSCTGGQSQIMCLYDPSVFIWHRSNVHVLLNDTCDLILDLALLFTLHALRSPLLIMKWRLSPTLHHQDQSDYTECR